MELEVMVHDLMMVNDGNNQCLFITNVVKTMPWNARDGEWCIYIYIHTYIYIYICVCISLYVCTKMKRISHIILLTLLFITLSSHLRLRANLDSVQAEWTARKMRLCFVNRRSTYSQSSSNPAGDHETSRFTSANNPKKCWQFLERKHATKLRRSLFGIQLVRLKSSLCVRNATWREPTRHVAL